MTFFSPIQFLPLLKNFSSLTRTEGFHVTICFLFLTRGIKQIHSSHSLNPLKTPPCFFIVATNVSHPLVFWIHGNLCPLSNIQKNPTTISQISAFPHTEQRLKSAGLLGRDKSKRFSMPQSLSGQRGAANLQKTNFYSAVTLGREFTENIEWKLQDTRRTLNLMAQTHTGNCKNGKYFSESALPI